MIFLYRRFSIRIASITSAIYGLFIYSYFINLSIFIFYLSISDLSSLSLVFINMGRNFSKRLKDNKIRVRFVIRLLEILIDRSCDRRVNTLDF